MPIVFRTGEFQGDAILVRPVEYKAHSFKKFAESLPTSQLVVENGKKYSDIMVEVSDTDDYQSLIDGLLSTVITASVLSEKAVSLVVRPSTWERISNRVIEIAEEFSQVTIEVWFR